MDLVMQVERSDREVEKEDGSVEVFETYHWRPVGVVEDDSVLAGGEYAFYEVKPDKDPSKPPKLGPPRVIDRRHRGFTTKEIG